jgi:hypothetical protein
MKPGPVDEEQRPSGESLKPGGGLVMGIREEPPRPERPAGVNLRDLC